MRIKKRLANKNYIPFDGYINITAVSSVEYREIHIGIICANRENNNNKNIYL